MTFYLYDGVCHCFSLVCISLLGGKLELVGYEDFLLMLQNAFYHVILGNKIILISLKGVR